MRGRAVVVGAGIGGLSTAIGLGRAGWQVEVLERWPEVVGLGAALGLWPQARRALPAGVAERVERESVPTGDVAVRLRDGRTLLHLPARSPRVPDVRLLSRRRLMELLVGAARDAGVRIRTGIAADGDLLRDAAREADLLVGADGLRSSVRTCYFGDRSGPRYSGLVGYRGAVDLECDGHGETWGDGAIIGITAMEGGRTNFYAAVPAAADAVESLAGLRQRYAGWCEPIPSVLRAARPDDLLRNPIHDLHPALGSFVHGRVALLGDAAHAMTPHLGRGACEALVDAACLVAQLERADDVPAALEGYDRARRRPAQRVAARSWQMRAVAHARRAAPIRDTLLRAAARLVPAGTGARTDGDGARAA